MVSILCVLLLAPAAPDAPQHAKTVELSTILFESPEMLDECLKATACEELRASLGRAASDERDRLRKAYQPSSKPVDDMTPEELADWKSRRAKLASDLKQVDDKLPQDLADKGCLPKLATPEQVCNSATTAVLSKGIELTILKKTPDMLSVRVESGRATGKVGWVVRKQVSIEEPGK